MISTETSDDLNSLTSSSGEEVITATSRVGGGDGPVKRNRPYEKLSRLSSIRLSEKRCLKRTKKLSNTNNGNKAIGSTKKIFTKIPRPLSADSRKEIKLIEESVKKSKYQVELLKFDCFKKPHDVDNTLIKFMCPQRNFNTKKSLSQMDMQNIKNHSRKSSRDLVPVGYALKPTITEGDHASDRSLSINDDFFHYMREAADKEELDSRSAGMKIFATIMLNAWRKRREDVKRLNEEIIKSRKSAIKVKNQIHVLNSLFKIEQKQNDELNNRLRKMSDDQRKVQDLYDELNSLFMDEKLKNSQLHEHLLNKDKDVEGLEMVLKETKAQVFRSMAKERELESSLSSEQRKVQDLENNKNDLMTTVTELKLELNEKQNSIEEINKAKIVEIAVAAKKLEDLEAKIEEMNKKEIDLEEYIKINGLQKQRIDELTETNSKLNEQIGNYLVNRLKIALATNTFPRKTIQVIHLLGYYLLPAMPPPQSKSFQQILWHQ